MYRPYLNNIDPNKRILEIGPLCAPMIKKIKRPNNIFYADIRTTDEIKEFYKGDPSVNNAAICEIDYVVKNSYLDTFSGVEKFHYVLASHVIEHVPQLILFFQDIATVINPGGSLCLTIPDKRYCFDHFRIPTSFAEVYDIYKRGIKNHPMRVFDFFANAVPTFNNPSFWWTEQYNAAAIPHMYPFDLAQSAYERALNNEYVDVHFSVFTPESFLLLLYNMTRASLLPFKCIEFYTTRPNTFEFNVVLQLEQSLLLENSYSQKSELDNLINLIRVNMKPLQNKFYQQGKLAQFWGAFCNKLIGRPIKEKSEVTHETGTVLVTEKNFNAKAYLAYNPDVAAACAGNEKAALRHFRMYGKNEQRRQFADQS